MTTGEMMLAQIESFHRATKAIQNNDMAQLRMAIQDNENLVYRHSPQDEKKTLLHIAVECGNAEAIKMLMDCGADVNAHTNFWLTPLDMATAQEVKALLRLYGAQPGPMSSVNNSFYNLGETM